MLDLGYRQVRLVGVQGQRLLLAGLVGAWTAEIVLEGNAGPELCGDLNAAGLRIVCLGSAADGAGRGMRAGQLLLKENAADALGYEQRGGLIVVLGSAGHRAGLRQSGGAIVVCGTVGRLAGERQSDGDFYVHRNLAGQHLRHGQTGGKLVDLDGDNVVDLHGKLVNLAPWLERTAGSHLLVGKEA